MKIEKCPFCGKQIAEIGNCKNMEECEHFEECPAVEPYVCVVCSISKGGCGASASYQESVEKAIAAWNSRTGKDINVATNADRIRGMSDEELATWILENIDCDKENIMCIPALYKNSDKCDGRCRDGRLSWLKQPAKEE